MSRENFAANDRTYVVSPDEPLPVDFRWRAFIAGQARDDANHQPLNVPVSVTVDEPGFVVQLKDDSWFVIAGRGRDCVPLLASQPYTVHIELRAEHYDPKSVTKTIPQMVADEYPDLVELTAAESEMHFHP
jgi:hypothetical protein